jgi:hypothetical protein
MSADEAGHEGARGLLKVAAKVDVEFATPVKDAVDERTGVKLGDGKKFTVDYNSVEAAFLSYEGGPAR